MLINIIILPLISSIACGLFGRYFGYLGTTIVSTSLIGFTFLLSLFSFIKISFIDNICFCLLLGSWINLDLLYIPWSILFYILSVTMLIVINSISFLVHMYSSSYMSEDPHIARFMSYLSLFTFFMIILVTADNFLQLFFRLRRCWFMFIFAYKLLIY